jgi:hypothetical protein
VNNSRIVIRRAPGISLGHFFRNEERIVPVWAKDLGPANMEMWTPKDHRQKLLWDVRAGAGLKLVLPAAAEALDERNLWTFIKCLARGTHEKEAPPIDSLVCQFWEEFDVNDAPWNRLPGLCRWTAQAGSAMISFALHRRFQYALSQDAYRQRIKRLRQAGVELKKKKPVLVTQAEFKRPSTLVVIVTKL